MSALALIDYGAGNLHSVANALRAAGATGTGRPAVLWARTSLWAVLETWVVIVVGEMTGVQTGLGAIIMEARQLSRTDIVVSGMLVIGVAGFLSDRAVAWLGRRLLAWSPTHG